MNNVAIAKAWSVTLAVGVAAIGIPIAAPAEELLSAKDALARAFPKPIEVRSQWVALSDDQIEQIKDGTVMRTVPKVLQYHVVRSGAANAGRASTTNNGEVIGYAITHTVAGKHGPIRLLIATSPQLAVLRAEILASQERRGHSVRRQSFLSQFNGKSPGDGFHLRSDIDGITGATVSSRAVARGVREALLMLSVLTPGIEKEL